MRNDSSQVPGRGLPGILQGSDRGGAGDAVRFREKPPALAFGGP
jgi:hypothetical protein